MAELVDHLAKKMLNLQRPEALVLSILQPKTSESFLKKYSTVSTTAQEHMLAEMLSW